MSQISAVQEPRVKFATQIAPDILEALREESKREGRHMQAIIEDALREHFESKCRAPGRGHVMKALQASMKRHIIFPEYPNSSNK